MPAPPTDPYRARRQAIGARIREERQAAGLTQEQVANRVGTDRPSVVLIEQGERNFTINMLLGLADAINCDLAVLIR